MTALCDLAAKYGTDKSWPHRYTPVYFDRLHSRVQDVKRVLEIGICTTRDIPNGRTGASLFMWEEFFPHASIFGVDIDPASMVNTGRITSALGDQSDPHRWGQIFKEFGGQPFDVIVDDGSHDPVYQTAAAVILLGAGMLAPGGHYFIEDIYVDPEQIIDAIAVMFPERYKFDIYEGGKQLPPGYGRREFGGPPAGEILLTITER